MLLIYLLMLFNSLSLFKFLLLSFLLLSQGRLHQEKRLVILLNLPLLLFTAFIQAAVSVGGYVITRQSAGQHGNAHHIFPRRYLTNGTSYLTDDTPAGIECQANTNTEDYQGLITSSSLIYGGFIIA